MAKFKVGDKVRLNSSQYPQYYSAIGTVTSTIYINESNQSFVYKYTVTFSGGITEYYVEEKWLELVEPEILFPFNMENNDEYWYNIKDEFSYLGYLQKWEYKAEDSSCHMHFINPNKPVGMNASDVFVTKENYNYYLFTTAEKEAYEKEGKIKKAFERPILGECIKGLFFDETNFVRNQDMSDVVTKWNGANAFDGFKFNKIPVMKGTLELVEEIMNYGKPKNRIPDRVVFNQDKGKVTVLISKHMDGVEPYWAYTSKVHADGGDKFDAEFGFVLSYYKYLIRHLETKEHQEMIERLFKLPRTQRFVYLLGVIEQEVLKVDGVKSYNDWQDIYLAITDTKGTNVFNHTWDYAEWKEMLRVHELETKREHQKEISKQIKSHQLEIDKLKGDNNKK